MGRGLGCVGLLIALAVIAAAIGAAAPELLGVVGLYSYVIGKGAIDGLVGRPMFATLKSFDPTAVNKYGDITNALIDYTDGHTVKQATVDLLPRPISRPYRIGEQLPVLINRVDGSRAKYDAGWANRPEHQARLAPIREMIERHHRQKAN